MEIRIESLNTELICHRRYMGPDSHAPLHFHRNTELCQPLNHPCDFLVNGTRIHAEPGDIITIGPQVVHQFLPLHPDTAIRILQFPVRILLQSGCSGTAVQTHITGQAMERIPDLYSSVHVLMDLMEREPRVYTGEKNELLQSLMISLYLLLLKHFPSEDQPGLRKDADLFFRATEYVNAHFTDEALTIESLACALFVSRKKLSAVFLQYTGISCKQYIHTLRVDYANRLMAEGMDITTASLKSGFASIRTFNNVYKAITGMSPTDHIKTGTGKPLK